jgi:hypothetical protein
MSLKGVAMNRRELFALTAATVATAMAASRVDPARIRTRTIGKVETISIHRARAEWFVTHARIDQGAGNKAYLVPYEGKSAALV